MRVLNKTLQISRPRRRRRRRGVSKIMTQTKLASLGCRCNRRAGSVCNGIKLLLVSIATQVLLSQHAMKLKLWLADFATRDVGHFAERKRKKACARWRCNKRCGSILQRR